MEDDDEPNSLITTTRLQIRFHYFLGSILYTTRKKRASKPFYFSPTDIDSDLPEPSLAELAFAGLFDEEEPLRMIFHHRGSEAILTRLGCPYNYSPPTSKNILRSGFNPLRLSDPASKLFL